MKFEIKGTITAIIEADNSHDAKMVFKQGIDVGYTHAGMTLVVLNENDTRTVINKKSDHEEKKSARKRR